MDEGIFRIVVCIGVLLACIAFIVQAVAMIALYKVAKNTQARVMPLADKVGPIADRIGPLADKIGPVVDKIGPVVEKAGSLADQAVPILSSAREILEENRPRIAEISAEALATAKSARRQVDNIGDILNDAGDRARARIAQIDRSVDETVEQVGQVSGAVKRTVLRPVRGINGVMSAFGAAVSAYLHGRKSSVDHATQDEEMFI